MMNVRADKKFYTCVILLVLGCIVAAQVWAKTTKYSYEDIIRLEKVVNKVSEFYVEEIDTKVLVESAIEGLRNVLDPHTAYFTEKDYDNLKVSTEGAFGGLGITIAIRENVLTIISPLQGTPAFRMGLQAGDKILEIEGESTKGITIDKAVEKLRGKPGSSVTIKIFREGAVEPMEFTVVRDIIQIQSVPFATMLNDSVGYVKVTQFSKNTTDDLMEALKGLKARGLTSLVLDLRNNPGGLLNQAISVASLFLKKDQLVVYTKGRTRAQNKEYHSLENGMWDPSHRLVVLVNTGSASASEIVAGAVQDHDRGLIMGKPTFGKGSVQTILPLDAQKYALKLTTAYYYTPSGRNINKPENAVRAQEGEHEMTEATEDTVPKDSAEAFLTDSGRKVYAAGGITPDVDVDGITYNRYVRELERKTMFFKYVVKERPSIEKKGKITSNFKITDDLLEDFRGFLYSDTSFIAYKGASHIMLDEFEKTLEKEREVTGDTLPSEAKQKIDSLAEQLDTLLAQQTRKEFDRNLDYISFALKRELLQAALGDSLRNVHELTTDIQLKEAVKYLNQPKLYVSSLTKQKSMASSKKEN